MFVIGFPGNTGIRIKKDYQLLLVSQLYLPGEVCEIPVRPVKQLFEDVDPEFWRGALQLRNMVKIAEVTVHSSWE